MQQRCLEIGIQTWLETSFGHGSTVQNDPFWTGKTRWSCDWKNNGQGGGGPQRASFLHSLPSQMISVRINGEPLIHFDHNMKLLPSPGGRHQKPMTNPPSVGKCFNLNLAMSDVNRYHPE